MALVQHWKCQDNEASTTVLATVGTNGTLLGGDNTSAKAVSGPGTALTSAFDLNGTDDTVDISASSISFAAGAAFSVGLWFWDDSSIAGRYFGTNGSGNQFIRKESATTITVRTVANSTFTVPSISTGQWHHLLVTRTAGNSVRLFVDGVESSTGALSNANTFSIDRFGMQNANFHDGRVCDVRVYNSDESGNVEAIMAEKDGEPTFATIRELSHRPAPFTPGKAR